MEEGSVDMQKIHTDNNLAEVMIKPINTDKFKWCRSSCGLAEKLASMDLVSKEGWKDYQNDFKWENVRCKVFLALLGQRGQKWW